MKTLKHRIEKIIIIVIFALLYSYINLLIFNKTLSKQPCNTANYSRNNFDDLLFYPGIAVIVDNRVDLSIPSRVLNVLTHIPNTWAVQIIYGTSNYKYLTECKDFKSYIENGRIILTKLFDEKLFSLPNKLFTNITFYEQIKGEKILIFQLDSLFCSNSPHKITDYLQYDYIGKDDLNYTHKRTEYVVLFACEVGRLDVRLQTEGG
jgi:hypothetical protein